MASHASSPIPSSLSLALRHPLNALLLGVVGLSAFFTGSFWPLLVGAVAEGAWLVMGPNLDETQRQRRWLAREANERATLLDEQVLLRRISEADRRRFLELDVVRKEIHGLVEGHDSLTLDMMSQELHKVDRLLTAYLRVAGAANAQASALSDTDVVALEAERVALPSDDKQGREVIGARLAQAAALETSVEEARAELGRVEQSLRLIRDQIATMRRPEELAEKLDDLVQTVEVVAATGRETELIGQHGKRVAQSIQH